MKKLLATGVAVAALLVTAVPALATGRHHRPSTPTVTNTATVRQLGVSVANTGLNDQNGGTTGNHRHHNNGGDRNMVTGDAFATTYVNAEANNNDCGCLNNGRTNVRNTANVTQVGVSVANTGLNDQNGGNGDRRMRTGAADAYTSVGAVVNSTVSVQ